MSFLKKITAIDTDDDEDIYVNVTDVYANDPQYKQFVGQVADILHKMSIKFHTEEKEMLNMFIQHLKREL